MCRQDRIGQHGLAAISAANIGQICPPKSNRSQADVDARVQCTDPPHASENGKRSTFIRPGDMIPGLVFE